MMTHFISSFWRVRRVSSAPTESRQPYRLPVAPYTAPLPTVTTALEAHRVIPRRVHVSIPESATPAHGSEYPDRWPIPCPLSADHARSSETGFNPGRRQRRSTRLKWHLGLLALVPMAALAQDFLPPEAQVRSAIAQQAEVRAAGDRALAAQAEARAYTIGAHEFELSATPQRRKTDTEGHFDEWEAEIGRAIRLPGKARLDRRIGQQGQLAAERQLENARHQAARKLLELWMNYLRTGLTAEESRQQRDSLAQQTQSLARQVQLGDAAQLDLELLEAELAQAEAVRLQAETDFTSSALTLSREFPSIPLPESIRTLPDPEPLPNAQSHWTQRIIANSHIAAAADAEALRQDAVAARARADRIADPSLGVRMSSERDGEEKVIGLVLSVPLGGRYRRATAEAESANAAALQNDATAVRRDIDRDAHLTVVRAENTYRQWQAQQIARRAMSAANQRTQRARALGEISLAEQLIAERNARQAALLEAASRVDALQAYLQVLIDSHRLWSTGHEPADNDANRGRALP